VALLRYLKEFVQLRLTVTRDVEAYRGEGQLLWFDQMPRDCPCPLWTPIAEGREDIWLEVTKQTLPDPPPLPASLQPWVEPSVSARTLNSPHVRSEIPPLPEAKERADGEQN